MSLARLAARPILQRAAPPQVHVVKGRTTVYRNARRFILPEGYQPAGDLAAVLDRMPRKPAAKRDARTFLASFDVVPEAWINAIASPFQALIVPGRHLLLLALVLTAAMLAPLTVDSFGHIPAVRSLNLNNLGRIGLNTLWSFLSLSALLVFHEIGHAAACRRVGARADCLGVGFYLLFPAFYTKLSLVRLLDRRERVIVFSSGVYFQAMGSVALALAAVALQDRWLNNLAHLNNFTIFLNLAPVMRFDGQKILNEYAGELARIDRWNLLKIAVIASTVGYMAFALRALARNLFRLADQSLHGGPDAATLVFGGLSLLGLVFFVITGIRLLRANLG